MPLFADIEGNGRFCLVKKLYRADSIISKGVDKSCKYLLVDGKTVVGTFKEGEINPSSPDYEFHDFEGYIITPGFIDAHNHLLTTALQIAFGFDLSPEKQVSIKNLVMRISRFSKEIDFPWIVGRGLNPDYLEEKRLPTRYDLDTADNDKPVFLIHQSGHAAVCNSIALEISGLDKNFPDPPGGKIERDSNGEPIGVLHEKSAMDIVRAHIPQYSKEDYKRALNLVQDLYLREGITCVKDTGGNGALIIEPQRVDAINELERNGQLKIRIAIALPIFNLDNLESMISTSVKIIRTERVMFGGYKLFLDGSGVSKTAWVKEDWNIDMDTKEIGNKGIVRWDLTDFGKVFHRLSEIDTNISIHAIGDAAVEYILNLIKKEKKNGGKATYSIVHAYIPSDQDIEAMKEYDVSIETQPSFIYLLGAQIAKNLGRGRFQRMFPMKSYVRNEIRACITSDSPVSPFKPSYGIFSSMRREVMSKDFEYSVINSDERISFEEAVNCYTANPSEIIRNKNIGSLEKGKLADFLVWDKKLMDLTSEDLADIKPKAVYVAGIKVA